MLIGWYACYNHIYMHPSAHGAIVVCQDRAAILRQIAQFYTEELDMHITNATSQARSRIIVSCTIWYWQCYYV